MTTGYEGLDLLLALILVAATFWYGYSMADVLKEIVNKLIKKYKKKTYWLTVYHKDRGKSSVATSFRERNMRNAILSHQLSYGCDLSLLKLKIHTKYNDIGMVYTLEINGETHIFAMHKDRKDTGDEQR